MMVASSIAASLDELARHLAGLGRLDDALAVSEGAVEAYRELAADLPDEYGPLLAGALGTQAAFLAMLGRQEEAAVVRAEARAVEPAGA